MSCCIQPMTKLNHHEIRRTYHFGPDDCVEVWGAEAVGVDATGAHHVFTHDARYLVIAATWRWMEIEKA